MNNLKLRATSTNLATDAASVLRSETSQAHRNIEKTLGMGQLMDKRISLVQYANILSVWHNWLQVNEAEIFGMLADCAPRDLAVRTKGHWLDQDLQQLAHLPNQVSVTCTPKIFLRSKFEALGALYVLEGSSMGGQLIIKRLRSKLDTDLSHHFYTGYGEQTLTMWRGFIEHINECLTTPAAISQGVEGANKTFESLTQAFNQPQLGHKAN